MHIGSLPVVGLVKLNVIVETLLAGDKAHSSDVNVTVSLPPAAAESIEKSPPAKSAPVAPAIPSARMMLLFTGSLLIRNTELTGHTGCCHNGYQRTLTISLLKGPATGRAESRRPPCPQWSSPQWEVGLLPVTRERNLRNIFRRPRASVALTFPTSKVVVVGRTQCGSSGLWIH